MLKLILKKSIEKLSISMIFNEKIEEMSNKYTEMSNRN